MTQQTVAEMLIVQADALEKMKRNLENFKNEPVFSKQKLDRLNTRLTTYKTQYDDFLFHHRRMVMAATSTEKKNDYFVNNHIDDFEDAYLDAVSAVQEQITKVTGTAAPAVNDSSSNESFAIIDTNTNTQSEIRLPPLELPTFSGNEVDWPSFSDLFTASIHKCRTTDANKLLYLKRALRGKAVGVIADLATTNANFNIAWNLLKEKYENKRVLFAHAMSSVLEMETAKRETSSVFADMLNKTDAAVNLLNSIGIDKTIIGNVFAFLIYQKLPIETIGFIEQSLDSHEEITSLDELKKLLNIRISSLEMVERRDTHTDSNNNHSVKSSNVHKSQNNSRKVNTNHYSSSKTSHTTGSSNNNNHNGNSIACKLCSEFHPVRLCGKFLAMSSRERESTVERMRLCRNCLSSSHLIASCKSQRNCRECGARHHTLTHPHNNQPNTSNNNATHSSSTSDIHAGSSQHTSHNTGNQVIRSNLNRTINVHSFRQVLLATAIVKVQAKNGAYIPLRALLDQGGDGSSITDAAVQMLQLSTLNQRIEVKPFGGGASIYANKVVELNLKSIHNDSFRVTAPAVVMKTLTDFLPSNYVKVDKWSHIEGLQLADPEFFKPSKIDLVLGADVYYCALMEGLRKGPIGTPMAQQTELGWILSGPLAINKEMSSTIVQNHVTIGLNESIQRFFELESVPEVTVKSKEDQYCEEFFNNTIERKEDGRLQMRLPFKTPHDPNAVLGKSKFLALQQFLRLERRFKSNAKFREEYKKGMEDYITQNHMQIAVDTEEDCIRYTPEGELVCQSYYIPHHAVIKESSTTTKLRNVFNASQKSSNGKSLNDILYTGPVMLADLLSILINWRCHRIAYCADIQQMYRQIHIHPSDITYQRLFWRSDFSEEIKEYCMNRLTFGTNFAPSFAIMGIKYLAKTEEAKFPHGAAIIRDDTYMDDTMSGNSTTELALRDQRETIDILQGAGLNLRKWASNSKEILEAVPEEHREVNVSLDRHESIKALGTFWDTATDTFSFRVNIDESKEIFTKRAIISTICKLFDPLGLVSPVIARAKLLMKRVCRSTSDWDEKVDESIATDWRKYLLELQSLHLIKPDRWISFLPNHISLQLHGFCDASLEAYGAVIYLRAVHASNEITTRLILSKSRVAPMTPTTITRLELCGAVVLAELMKFVINTMRHMKIEAKDVKLWTDSQTALQWISNDPSRWQMFVANRVVAIQKATRIEQWRHVRSEDNPADLISRGASPNDLHLSNLWWFGPEWLQKSESEWPESELGGVDPLEERRAYHINTHIQTRNEYLNRFSTLRKLIRSTAWFHRLFSVLRKQQRQYERTLTALELHSATMFWVRVVQGQEFAREIESLQGSGSSDYAKQLNNLHPFIDSEGILRVGGRLKNSELSFNEKHPIILPSKHHFTKLVILSAHHRTMHGGTQLTMAHIRKSYWILHARRTISTNIHRCVACHRQRAKGHEQLMADLPAARVRISRPFSHVGVDFCGPFLTRASKGRGIKTNKSYVAVFVCLCVKAIHLELVSDLSSEAFLAAYRRFISRRGLPSCMYSDNGTNFVGANGIIREKQTEYDEFITEITITSLANEGIEWKFNPPASPHFGGLFEAGVKSTKFHLKRVLGDASLTFEEFYTVLTQIEACLNSRPLIPQSDDPNDFSIITPGHFLTGDSLLALPEISIADENVAIGNRYRYLRRLRDIFWAQWSSEYLNRLQNRPKWCKKTENIKINDMVLLRDERLPPTKWALARVLATHPGADGLVRVVTIKTSSGEFKRPVAKLSLLPIYEDNQI